jgi:uncharacterized protein YbaR (Trm112 family)
MACPICKSDQFYVKDPDDEYETVEFEYRDGKIAITEGDSDAVGDDIVEKREIFCQRCAWHGKKDAL